MALEPVETTLEVIANTELANTTLRYWLALIVTLPVFNLEMGTRLFPMIHERISPQLAGWIQFILATPVVFWAGWPFFVRGWASLKMRNLSMFTMT
jgi:cation transport ATPase